MEIDRTTNIIKVLKTDSFMTLISGTLYECDTDAFRLALKAVEDDEEGIVFGDTHEHFTSYTVSGITYSRKFEIISPYSIEFEDGQYSVRLVGSNTNLFDVAAGILVQNQVQVISQNSVGGIDVTLLPTDTADAVWNHNVADSFTAKVSLIEKILRNRMSLDPDTGVMTVYDDDDVTILFSATVYKHPDESETYDGAAAHARGRLT